jgi:hypothetical protein
MLDDGQERRPGWHKLALTSGLRVKLAYETQLDRSPGSYLRVVQQLFDVPWRDLTVESVRRFLAEATHEGLTWEAKGSRAPRRDTLLKAVCGFANAVGGYLIVGAERQEDTWSLPGVEFPIDEPVTWLSSLIAPSGLSPLPFFDAKAFAGEDGRQSVVVMVEPIASPPCITASGIVYQRVSGQTLPLTDQRALSDLIEKGETARAQTESFSLHTARSLLATGQVFNGESNVFSLALCATGGPQDKAGVLFDQDHAERFSQLVFERLQPDFQLGYAVQAAVRQDRLQVWTTSEELGRGTIATANWNGVVAITLANTTEGDYHVPDITRDVARFWPALAEAVRLFGGVGDAHLTLILNTKHHDVRTGGRAMPVTDVRRWTTADDPTRDEVDGVVRELERGFGRVAWEPSTSPQASRSSIRTVTGE